MQLIRIDNTSGSWKISATLGLTPSNYGVGQLKVLPSGKVIMITAASPSQIGDIRVLEVDGKTINTLTPWTSDFPSSLAVAPDGITAYVCGFYTLVCVTVNTANETITPTNLKNYLGYTPMYMAWPSSDTGYAYTAGVVGPDPVNLVTQLPYYGYRLDAVQNLGLAASSIASNGNTVDTIFSLRNGVLNQYTVTEPLREYAVVNAADYSSNSISPGEIVAVFGANMTAQGASCAATTEPLPTTLCGTQVLSCCTGTPVPLYYVSPGQINLQVPSWDSNGGATRASFQLSYGGTTIPPAVSSLLAAATPALFTGNGLVAVNGANWTTLQAMAGQVAVFYANGLGPTSPQVASGAPAPGLQPHDQIARITGNLSMTICGTDVSNQVQFAGLTPGLVGLYQINVPIPAACASVPATANQSSLIQISVQ